MDTVEVKHKYLLSKWAPIIQSCRTSGMTVKAWCQENNINEKQFFYWQRRVREEISSLSSELPATKPNTTFVSLKSSETKSCTENILDLIWFYVLAAPDLNFQIRHHRSCLPIY